MNHRTLRSVVAVWEPSSCSWAVRSSSCRSNTAGGAGRRRCRPDHGRGVAFDRGLAPFWSLHHRGGIADRHVPSPPEEHHPPPGDHDDERRPPGDRHVHGTADHTPHAPGGPGILGERGFEFHEGLIAFGLDRDAVLVDLVPVLGPPSGPPKWYDPVDTPWGVCPGTMAVAAEGGTAPDGERVSLELLFTDGDPPLGDPGTSVRFFSHRYVGGTLPVRTALGIGIGDTLAGPEAACGAGAVTVEPHAPIPREVGGARSGAVAADGRPRDRAGIRGRDPHRRGQGAPPRLTVSRWARSR